MGRVLRIYWQELKVVWDYVAIFVSVLGLLYSFYMLAQYFTGNIKMEWTLDQVLLACGAFVFCAGFIFALVIGTIKSFKKDAENGKPKKD